MEYPPGAGGPPSSPHSPQQSRSPQYPPRQSPRTQYKPQVPSSPPSRYSSPPDISPEFRPGRSTGGLPSTGPRPGLPSPTRPPPNRTAPSGRPPNDADPGLPYSTLLQPQSDAARVVLGLVLLAVPVIATVFAYVLPTIRTIELSRIEGLSVFGSAETIGPANYDEVFADGAFIEGLLRLAGPIGAMVLIGAVLAPLAAWCLHRAGRRVRTTASVVWSLAAITFAPAALTVAWLIDRVLTQGDREASLYDWAGLASGVILGLGVLAGLAAMRGAAETGKKTAGLLVTAGLAAFALIAAGLQTFAYGVISGLPLDIETPVAQIFRGLYSGFAPGISTAKSVLLMAILAVLGLGAAIVFLAARTRIDVAPGPVDPAPTRPGAVVFGIAALVLLLGAVGYFLLPWIARLAEGTTEGGDLWFAIRRTWGPPLITTAVALPVAAMGGYAIGSLRPFGNASRWILLLFAPWLFIGSGPLGAANLEVVAGEGEYMVIGSFPARAWIAVPLLFVFTALFWGLEDRRRLALAQGAAAGRRAWRPSSGLADDGVDGDGAAPRQRPGPVLAAAHVPGHALLGPDDLGAGERRVRAVRCGPGLPIPILISAALAAAAAAVWYLPRLAIKVGKRLRGQDGGAGERRPLYSPMCLQPRTNSMSWKRRATVS